MKWLFRACLLAAGTSVLLPLTMGCSRTAATVLMPPKQPHPVVSQIEMPVRTILAPPSITLPPPDPLSAAADRLAENAHYDPSAATRISHPASEDTASPTQSAPPRNGKGYVSAEGPCGCSDAGASKK